MRVVVRHGHFAFYPRNRSDVLHFRRMFTKLPFNQLFAKDDYFTFLGLVNLPRWSQIGVPYGGTPAIINYEGEHPYQVMRANRFVYSMQTTLVVPAVTFAPFQINLKQGRDFLISPKTFIQPGCLFSIDNIPRGVLTGYTGDLNLTEQRLYLESVEAII